MPRTTTTRKITRKAGTRADSRKNQKRARCKGGIHNAKKNPTIAAYSIFDLKLMAKPGIEVVDKVGGNDHRSYFDKPDDYYQMYRDLLKAMQRASSMVKGETTTFDPLASGLGIGLALDFVIKSFENNIKPKGWSMNIDRDSDSYFFTLWVACPFPEFWHFFEIKYICQELIRTDRKLHDLFIIVIKTLISQADIISWWNGGLGYAECIIENQIEFWADNNGDDEESLKELEGTKKTYNDYEHGVAKKYEGLIRSVDSRTPASLLRSLSRFNKKVPMVQWMIHACEFLNKPGSTQDFIYYEMEQDEGIEGLRFEQQITLIWDLDDEYTKLEIEAMDAEVGNAGALPPVLNYRIGPECTSIDVAEMNERRLWAIKLSDLWREFEDINELIKNDAKRQNRTAG